MIPPTIAWFGKSTMYVSIISVYALIVSHAAAFAAEGAEEGEEELADDVRKIRHDLETEPRNETR